MGRPVWAMIADSGTHTVSMLTRSSQRGARMTYPSSVRPRFGWQRAAGRRCAERCSVGHRVRAEAGACAACALPRPTDQRSARSRPCPILRRCRERATPSRGGRRASAWARTCPRAPVPPRWGPHTENRRWVPFAPRPWCPARSRGPNRSGRLWGWSRPWWPRRWGSVERHRCVLVIDVDLRGGGERE